MAKVELNIVIDNEGTLTCEVKGAKGKACLKYMEMIEKMLGKVKSKKVTAEYYQEEVVATDRLKGKQ